MVLAHRPVTCLQLVKAQPVVQAQSGPEPASTYALPTPVLPLSRALLDTVAELRAEPEEQEEVKEEQISIRSKDTF